MCRITYNITFVQAQGDFIQKEEDVYVEFEDATFSPDGSYFVVTTGGNRYATT
jgi:hypothetical protein